MTLSKEARKTIAETLATLRRPVTVTVFTQALESLACKETRAIAEYLAESSQKISVDAADFVANGTIVRKYGIERIPAIAVSSKEGLTFRFEGVPCGFIFESLLKALVVASAAPEAKPAAPVWLEEADRGIELTVFSSPTCPEGPAMMDVAVKLAFSSQNALCRAVNVQDFVHLAVGHGVSALPSLYLGDVSVQPGAAGAASLIAFGPASEPDILDRLGKEAS